MTSKSGAHCHKLIRQTAQEMAHECYSELMRRNDWYQGWKALHPECNSKQLEDRWVAKKWGEFVEGARAILAEMLASIDDPDLQGTIHEALIADNFLTRGRDPKGWGIGYPLNRVF